jgi:hypothetical protein
MKEIGQRSDEPDKETVSPYDMGKFMGNGSLKFASGEIREHTFRNSDHWTVSSIHESHGVVYPGWNHKSMNDRKAGGQPYFLDYVAVLLVIPVRRIGFTCGETVQNGLGTV